ncbi:hypothetical protein CDL15_Pgr007991 [Punica granatum]|uniref:Uncharacterized protein n=1 Tax=Punica granatum TaxID=22663 RepID=A0A218VSC9_PUNGR|nr:hypothetical protein CDL15_Pgr022009 [Punica granatum]OWM65577.1 hypothetical protein CDL15_Pgr023847 [Punica granatum]OWM66611.1 hypothetical protein CDL15_Pgr005048 [Punica granatum]OWM66882.1 hypothetical protein CDL15_Pgr021995 [Punica granatum]OWM76615.1 hypothetical protein CDL15_Pgr009180 [Punica granatum]
MWRNSIHRDSHPFVDDICRGFLTHRMQTFQTRRAQSKESCAQNCSPSEKSEIDSVVSLWIFAQNSLITESFRASWLRFAHA